jgi:phosphatidylserine/phosphatidylglycerophosphate/cardiolipin synthase-like enzyme
MKARGAAPSIRFAARSRQRQAPGTRFLGALLLAFALSHSAHATDVAACFTPAEHCLDRIVAAIGGARRQIRMQAYEFTSRPILAALLAAARRGVDVRIIVDRGAVRDRAADAAGAGLAVLVDQPAGIAHTKAIIIDGRLVIGGSYNYTHAAETENVEDVTFITAPDIAAAFMRNWEARAAVATPLSDVEGPRHFRRRHRYAE